MPLNTADFPAISPNIHPKYRTSRRCARRTARPGASPTRFSFYGISYNTKYVSEEEASSWNNLFLPKFKGKIVMFDWYLPNMSNASLAVMPEQPDALRHQRCPARQGEGVAVQAAPADRVVLRAEPGPGQRAGQRGRDQSRRTATWTSTMIGRRATTTSSRRCRRKAAIRWSEAACLCADSKNKELALKWIDYMSGAKVQSEAGLHQGLQGACAEPEGHQLLERGTDEADELRSRSRASRQDAGRDADRQESCPRGLPVQQPDDGLDRRSSTSSRPARGLTSQRAGGRRPRPPPPASRRAPAMAR